MTPTKAQFIEEYLDNLSQTLADLPREPLLEIIRVLRQARQVGKRIYIFGNGGSAATASHMVCDLLKNTARSGQPQMRIIGLCDNTPTFSAYANDEGYERVFSQPLLALGEPGDIAIAISGSGNSPNVIRAVQTAQDLGMFTIGLSGFAGGQLAFHADLCLVVPSDSMERIEDVHMVIDHILTGALRETD